MSHRSIAHVIFTDHYKQQVSQIDDSDVAKLVQAIDAHGYRGASKAKHNGVVNLKPDSDTLLWKALNQYYELDKDVITQSTRHNNEQFIIHVKVVAHCPDGTRLVGLLYERPSDSPRPQLVLYVLGFGNYTQLL